MKKIIFISILIISSLFANSIEQLKELGKKGNVDALMKLAMIYENGKGATKPDIKLAKRYYQQAKELGSEDAIIALSLMDLSNNSKVTHSNNSVEIAGEETLSYSIEISDLSDIIKKAKNGDSEALFTLATLYDSGYGQIKADPKRALLLYMKSAKLGNKKAVDVLRLKRSKLK